jgi:hypothetical protein
VTLAHLLVTQIAYAFAAAIAGDQEAAEEERRLDA